MSLCLIITMESLNPYSTGNEVVGLKQRLLAQAKDEKS